MNKGWVLVVGFVIGAVAACGGGSSGKAASSPPASTRAPDMTVTGNVELGPGLDLSSPTGSVGEECSLPAGFDDLLGSQVAITDDAGKTLGYGPLEGATVVSHTKDQPDMVCDMAFTILGVPRGLPVYKVTVGHRNGVVRETQADLEHGLTLTLN